jgi:hypothetical protein
MNPIQIAGTIVGCIIMIGWWWLVIKLSYLAIVAHHKRKQHRAAYQKFMKRWWE